MLALEMQERELTELEVEERLERLHELNAEIERARERCEIFTSHYRQKIIQAEENFETDTFSLRQEIDSLMVGLRRFAETNITGKRKSIKFPSGTLQLTKQSPQFFIGGAAVDKDNPKLIELARSLDADLIQSKEVVRWSELKKRLEVDESGNVYLSDTGEIVPDMRAKIIPDKFSIAPPK